MTETSSKQDRVIKYFEKQSIYSEEDGTHLALYTDTETTGLEDDAELWEIAVLPFTFSDEGKICKVFKPYVGREQPRKPLSEKIQSICGVTNEELEGKAFDDYSILALFQKAEIAIAHNAKFDRPKIHRRFPTIRNLVWADSAFDPDWESAGIHTRTLDYLAFRYGFYFDHHGALADCRAGVHILAQKLTDEVGVFESLLSRAFKGATTLELKSGFEQKDMIKNRGGYRWNPDKKVWYKVFTSDEELDRDMSFFRQNGGGFIDMTTMPEDLKKRFLK